MLINSIIAAKIYSPSVQTVIPALANVDNQVPCRYIQAVALRLQYLEVRLHLSDKIVLVVMPAKVNLVFYLISTDGDILLPDLRETFE
jgi:hypothetical protein